MGFSCGAVAWNSGGGSVCVPRRAESVHSVVGQAFQGFLPL